MTEELFNLLKTSLLNMGYLYIKDNKPFLLKTHSTTTYLQEFLSDYDLSLSISELRYFILNNIFTPPLCPVCGNPCSFNKNTYRKTCSSKKCITTLRGITYEKKTGYKNPSQNPLVKQQKEDTCFSHYGVLHPLQSSEIFNQMLVSNQKKYGEKYTSKLISTKENQKKRYFEKTGYLSPMHNPEVLQKRSSNYKKKTSYDYPMQNPEVRKKSVQTCLAKYGVENVSQSEETRMKVRRYVYDDLCFDSIAEFVFYLKKKSEGHNIEREPFTIKYFEDIKDEAPGRRRFYKPDFRIDNQLFEIKGDQFFNEKNEPYDAMNQRFWWGKFYKMQELGVICIRSSELQDLIKEIKREKGADFFSKYRRY